jgi:hypothetical protein
MVSLRDFDEQGACHSFDYSTMPDIAGYYYPWFGREGSNNDRGEKEGERIEREAIARSICASCDVVSQCLEYQLERESSSLVAGFIGGKSEEERKLILRARSKAMADA